MHSSIDGNHDAVIVAINGHLPEVRAFRPTPAGFGESFKVWLALQSGQEKICRFGGHVERYPKQIRHQNGYEHRASVCFVFDEAMIKMRAAYDPIDQLDEVMLQRCVNHHDEPEGLTGKDVLAPKKTDLDDFEEYEAYRKLCAGLDPAVWVELERAFLLQFCLKNPECFPEHAREVMTELVKTHRREAIFFDAVQRIDYLYYAFECYRDRCKDQVFHEVAITQIDKIDAVAREWPEFAQFVWTAELAAFFREAAQQIPLDLDMSAAAG